MIGIPVSINRLSELTGSDRRTITKWIKGQTFATEEEAVKFIQDRRKPKADPASQLTDPKTGLTWFHAKLREDTIQKRRENDIATKLAEAQYISTETHHRILSIVCGKLEQIPSKAKSELGLTDGQMKRLQKMLDEAREAAAEEVRKTPCSHAKQESEAPESSHPHRD